MHSEELIFAWFLFLELSFSTVGYFLTQGAHAVGLQPMHLSRQSSIKDTFLSLVERNKRILLGTMASCESLK